MQKLNAILVLFKTVKLIIVMAFWTFSQPALQVFKKINNIHEFVRTKGASLFTIITTILGYFYHISLRREKLVPNRIAFPDLGGKSCGFLTLRITCFFTSKSLNKYKAATIPPENLIFKGNFLQLNFEKNFLDFFMKNLYHNLQNDSTGISMWRFKIY